ncbi:MAG: transcriptional regulator [Variibacter sp.]|jgi:transcriptional regulator|nr:transcriptional regulator [Variibacter sp.]
MYVHPAFKADRAAALSFAAARGFGLVVACADGAPIASPVPFRIDYTPDGTPRASFHVAKANGLAGLAAQGGRWLLAVTGADAYVSPVWYASPDQVPTWLYEAVHLAGPVQLMSTDRLTQHLDELSDRFEATPTAEANWSPQQITPGRREMLMKAIVGIDMLIETVEGSFKLNQHKSDADHVAVAEALAARNDVGAQAISARMLALRPHLQYASTQEYAPTK